MKPSSLVSVLLAAACLGAAALAQTDQKPVLLNGTMWTFDHPPTARFAEAYGFAPDAAWFDDVRMSALRFANHCSASFVSAEGLVMTNFHCGLDGVKAVTRDGENLRRDGFYAATLEQERKVPGLFVEQLVEIQDVTGEVLGATNGAADHKAALAARTAAIAAIEQRLTEAPLRCQVVTFYHGAKFAAYRYRKYDDVRLVFSSELAFAFFGGIYDFWAYPRYSFDCDLFRVYEGGKPLATPHWFRWSQNGAAPGEPVFVVGNPGRTGRLVTAEMLEFERDFRAPFVVAMLDNMMAGARQAIRADPETADAAFDEYFGIVNSQEAYTGRLLGLRDAELIARRRAFDRQTREAIRKDPVLEAEYGSLWDDVAALVGKLRQHAPDLQALRPAGRGTSEYLRRAAAIVGYCEQMGRPEAERAAELRGTGAAAQRRRLQKPLAVDAQREAAALAAQLRMMQQMLPAGDPLLQQTLAGGTAEAAAARLLGETVLGDEGRLAQLLDATSLEDNQDPLVRLARVMVARNGAAAAATAPLAQELEQKSQRLGEALYKVYGNGIPPDATFTLRISDGVVDGYVYNGTVAPPFTTFYGMLDRNRSFAQVPDAWDALMNGNAFGLPERWRNPPVAFDLGTPMNFVSTCDIIGGNSGSPVINRDKQIVGLAFDGNAEGLPGDFIFAPDRGNRTISVHSQGILQALRHVYGAARVVDEIERSR
ncbi:MAG: S46 family peptidase [Planctomycetes bacterium]|nr:S46 family peptidase [Planctomycetota bacterium]